MRFLTSEEKKVLLFIVAFLVLGLVCQELRRWGVSFPIPLAPADARKRLAFHDAPPSSSSNFKIDLNRASMQELLRLPHVGPAMAGRIIELRLQRGHFGKPEEILDVPGIGPKTWEDMKDRVMVGASDK